MLLFVEGEQTGRMVDCIMMKHFGVQYRALGDKSDEVAEMRVGDIDHGCNGEANSILIVLHFFLFHISFIQ